MNNREMFIVIGRSSGKTEARRKMVETKAIEEMAKFVCNACEYGLTFDGDCDLYGADGYKMCCKALETAEALYNAGYTQKVNDDEVVISKEKIEEIKRLEHELGYREGAQKRESFYEEIAIPTERKETAREILQILEFLKGSVLRNYGVAETVGLDVAIRKIKEKFGVEVE